MSDQPVTPSAVPSRPLLRPLMRFLVLLLLLGLTAVLVLRFQLSPLEPGADPREFEVLPGWGASRVARALEDEGFVRHAEVFSLYLRVRQLDRSIGEGLYDLSPAMTLPEIAARLEAGGRPRTASVLIPEGLRAGEVADRLAAAGFADAATFMALIESPGELRLPYMPADAPLEGYLFPAVYDIPVRSGPEEVLGMMLDRFDEEVSDEAVASLEARGMSVHDWVTLASMVQAEAGGAAEMPVIAGVFLNRLDRGMLMQSDPTVAYGLGKALQELDAFAGDFTAEADHPWNTYTRAGLPVGPIGNPGAAALEAVLEPQRISAEGRPYLYFLHSRDGTVFRPNPTLEDHTRDVWRYLR